MIQFIIEVVVTDRFNCTTASNYSTTTSTTTNDVNSSNNNTNFNNNNDNDNNDNDNDKDNSDNNEEQEEEEEDDDDDVVAAATAVAATDNTGVSKALSNRIINNTTCTLPDSKVHGAHMGPTWGRQDPGGPHVGPMNLVIWFMTSEKWRKLYEFKIKIKMTVIALNISMV